MTAVWTAEEGRAAARSSARPWERRWRHREVSDRRERYDPVTGEQSANEVIENRAADEVMAGRVVEEGVIR